VPSKNLSRLRSSAALLFVFLTWFTAGAQQPSAAKVGPLNDRLLQVTDEQDVAPDLFSRVLVQYDHGSFNGAAENDRIRVSGQQSFNAANRLGVGYEIPFIDFRGGNGNPSGSGLGDIKLNFRAVLDDTGKFKSAALVEFTFPSASNTLTGFGQNIVKSAWGFSAPLASRTVLSATLAYNKAVSARPGQQGINSFEAEPVLAQEFAKRVAGFLDWDMYQDFNFDRFGQTMKGGLTIALDRSSRFSVTPYAQFPLNNFTSRYNIKSDVGFDLSVRY
jgi:hypothetical protein